MPIEKIREADIYYLKQFYSYDTFNILNPDEFGEVETVYSYVTDEQDIKYESSGLWNVGSICRDRIQTIDDFMASENFTNVYSCGSFSSNKQSTINQEGQTNLKECAWVIRFAETAYEYSQQSGQFPRTRRSYYIVSDVSILRLEGISDGKEFNLGVVDNKQSGKPNDPTNDTDIDWTIDLTGGARKKWQQILDFIEKYWLPILLGVVIGIPLVIVIIKFGLTAILKGLGWLIKAPFKLIGKLFKKE